VIKGFNIHADEMLLAFAVWLCSLPLIAFLVIPLFGLGTAGGVALGVLIILMAICWGACGWKMRHDNSEMKRNQ